MIRWTLVALPSFREVRMGEGLWVWVWAGRLLMCHMKTPCPRNAPRQTTMMTCSEARNARRCLFPGIREHVRSGVALLLM